MQRGKVLLMGQSGSGKTSMRSIIFANFVPKETNSLLVTTGAEKVPEIKFLDDLSLNLWDCGGQDVFWENYFLHKQDIFSLVQCMIFVFNVESKEMQKELNNYKRSIDALREFSPEAKIFCLVHKMDVLPDADRHKVFLKKEAEIRSNSSTFKPACFATSIWDESLFKAWSEVVNSMIPRREILLQHLEHFAHACEAHEVLLFERATFLVLASAGIRPFKDIERFEKLSNIIKSFKISCSKATKGSLFNEFEVRNKQHRVLGAFLTPNTFVLIVTDTSMNREATLANLPNARSHFTNLFEQLRSAAPANKK